MTPLSFVLVFINYLLLSFINEGDARGYTMKREGCHDGWSDFNGGCYKYFSDKKTWDEAQDQCVEEEANLVSIHSEEEHQFLMGLNGGFTWLGGRRDPRNHDNFVWSDGTPWDYSNWAPGEPNDYRGIEDCAYGSHHDSQKSQKWNDLPCSHKKTFVCKKGCPSGWTKSEGTCYKHFTEKRTWQGAEDYCNTFGGNLVSIHSSRENTLVGSLTTSKETWIGGKRVCQGCDEWTWTDGTPWDFVNWSHNEPNNWQGKENISGIQTDAIYGWFDDGADVDERKSFICSKKLSESPAN